MKPSISDVTKPEPAIHTGECANVSKVLSRIGDKWSVLIIIMLAPGTRRFSDLKRDIGGISQRMLTLCLRGLERDGLVKRTVYAVVPPRVEYALTEMGRSLCVPVMALGQWARSHIAEIATAQAAFDRKEDAD